MASPLATRGGETPAQALDAREGLPVDAILVNCTSAEVVGEAVAAFAALAPETAVGGYAHGFETVGGREADVTVSDAVDGRIAMTPAGYARFAREWIAAGATIVGGCCDVGPSHIAALRKLVEEDQ
ncbi:homocysteine S-methyltransferase family protein [Thalassobaculum salexigens]|uniref:homocysteine S-methyltransferase family protein n=1 Tax=Thalassobaculum salexigens TaxID=455360 RepID=UPI00248D44C8|nr:homocysteine S-methyltransferase family protein [Thalassobaculum salexigens]